MGHDFPKKMSGVQNSKESAKEPAFIQNRHSGLLSSQTDISWPTDMVRCPGLATCEIDE